MPRNLVLFSDGTGNSAAKLFKTNVWRVYAAVDLTDPQQLPQPRQFAFYDDGVGTSSFKPLAVLGGAFGVGLTRNVLDLYVFLCRMYKPGDRIYAFGFSRGAFTIRVLIGLVMTQGLIKYDGNEGTLQRLARDAYRAYRTQRFTSRNPLVGTIRRLRAWTLQGVNLLLRRTPYEQAERVGRPDTPDAITIEFLGLWDTVDAYGLPVDELTRAIDVFIWPLTMRDYNLNPRVRCARHALALDDERNAFHPRLWNERPDARGAGGVPGGNLATTHTDEERISQVWFAGMHSNVGGGYPDDSLSYVPLEWIMREAQARGLRFEQDIWDEQKALSDENGPIYDSRRGLSGYYRYNPRRIELLTDTPKVQVGRTKVHESVLRRIRAGHDGYAPITLPPGFAVVKIDGSIVEGERYLQGLPGAAAAPLVGQGAPYAGQREHVYNWVWRRRVAYFTTLAATLALALMPLVSPGDAPCTGRWCYWASPIKALGWLLPAFAQVWIDAFAAQPAAFLALLALLAIGLWRGSALQQAIGDQMRRVWYAVPGLNPPTPKPTAAPQPPGPLHRSIERLRRMPAYRQTFRLLTHALLPTGFLASILYLVVVLASQLPFAHQASTGRLCAADAAAVALRPGADSRSTSFATGEPCFSTGVLAVQGATYRVRITVPAASRWSDDSLPAGPHGFSCPLSWQRALMFGAAVPLRRHPGQGWFQPMARIGSTGSDTYPLSGTPQTAPPSDRCAAGTPAASPEDEIVEATVVARSSGPLYLYVNDAVDLPFGLFDFYKNNRGSATVRVTLWLPPPDKAPD